MFGHASTPSRIWSLEKEACGEYVQALDTALKRCPGTSAWHDAEQKLEEP